MLTPLVREPIGESAAAGLAQVFKALADPVRLRLVSLIGAHQGGEACVCELTTAFDLTQPTISHHLKVLRKPGSSTASAAVPGCTTGSSPPRWSGWPRYCPVPAVNCALPAAAGAERAGNRGGTDGHPAGPARALGALPGLARGYQVAAGWAVAWALTAA